jgi:uncharacterized surface protein with fasciclin (FAS1) repeats
MQLYLPLLNLATAAIAQDLVSVIQSQPDLTRLLGALQTVPDIVTLLNSSTNITILAPTDTAFEALLAEPLNAENQALETQDVNATTNLLSYHVLKGLYPSSGIGASPTFPQTLFTSAIPILGSQRNAVTGGQHGKSLIPRR